MSKAVVCWESNIVTAGSGCDSVDAISTMWTHTGYIIGVGTGGAVGALAPTSCR